MPTLQEKTEKDRVTQAILEHELWRDADATGEHIVVEGPWGGRISVNPRARHPVHVYGVSSRKRDILIDMFALIDNVLSSSSSCPFVLSGVVAGHVSAPHRSVSNELRRVFMLGEDEDFEDGGESEFRHSLGATIRRHGADAVKQIQGMILGGTVTNVVAAEALVCLGELQDAETHKARLEALEAALSSSSVVIRDAAILGLADLADPNAVASVERARDVEVHAELRSDLEYVLTRLRAQN